jgi:hypothetical protein
MNHDVITYTIERYPLWRGRSLAAYVQFQMGEMLLLHLSATKRLQYLTLCADTAQTQNAKIANIRALRDIEVRLTRVSSSSVRRIVSRTTLARQNYGLMLCNNRGEGEVFMHAAAEKRNRWEL